MEKKSNITIPAFLTVDYYNRKKRNRKICREVIMAAILLGIIVNM